MSTSQPKQPLEKLYIMGTPPSACRKIIQNAISTAAVYTETSALTKRTHAKNSPHQGTRPKKSQLKNRSFYGTAIVGGASADTALGKRLVEDKDSKLAAGAVSSVDAYSAVFHNVNLFRALGASHKCEPCGVTSSIARPQGGPLEGSTAINLALATHPMMRGLKRGCVTGYLKRSYRLMENWSVAMQGNRVGMFTVTTFPHTTTSLPRG